MAEFMCESETLAHTRLLLIDESLRISLCGSFHYHAGKIVRHDALVRCDTACSAYLFDLHGNLLIPVSVQYLPCGFARLLPYQFSHADKE